MVQNGAKSEMLQRDKFEHDALGKCPRSSQVQAPQALWKNWDARVCVKVGRCSFALVRC